MNVLNLIDIAILAAVLVCSFETVRVLNPLDNPWKAIGFVLIAIGSFGWINYDIAAGHPVAWYALALHAGFAVCSVVILHNQQRRRRSTDHLISKKTLQYLATHRITIPPPKR